MTNEIRIKISTFPLNIEVSPEIFEAEQIARKLYEVLLRAALDEAQELAERTLEDR